MTLLFEPEDDLNGENWKKPLTKVASEVQKLFTLPKKIEVEVSFLPAEEMQVLNVDTRGINKVTDVLSYPCLNFEEAGVLVYDKTADVNPESGNLMMGSIVLCSDKIAEQAVEYGHSFMRELCYLFTHGLLHLLGFDHEKEEQQKAMREAEEKILEKLNLSIIKE